MHRPTGCAARLVPRTRTAPSCPRWRPGALRGILTDLANLDGDRARILCRATRAAAYLLTFTAQPRRGQDKDLSEILLERLAGHPDEVTAQLSRWALDFRFAPDGTIRPLLDAP
jgi:hypothetical protein